MNLEKKICLVTGGSRGIGKEIVHSLSSYGAIVFFTYLTKESEATYVEKSITENGGTVYKYQMDVTKRDSIKSLMNHINDQHGRLDVLVNNAGINNPTDFLDISDNDWDLILDVNLKGPFLVTQEAFTLLGKAESSSVVHIGSVSGQYGGPRTAHYAASKAGLISLSQVIARFGAEHNIRSNVLSAGLVVSEMAEEGLSSKMVSKAAENILLKRFAEKSEIAEVVAFLASDKSNYITAQTINVNGGLYF